MRAEAADGLGAEVGGGGVTVTDARIPEAQKGPEDWVCLFSHAWPRPPVLGGSGEDQAGAVGMPTLSLLSGSPGSQMEPRGHE